MKNYTFFTLLVLIGSILGSCEIPDVDSSREEEILKSHKWRRFSYTENGVEKIEFCMKDDIYEFFDDGTANVIRFNDQHLLLDTILISGTYQDFISSVVDPLLDLQESFDVVNPRVVVIDSMHVEGGIEYVLPKGVAVCSEDFTGYDTPILNWHYEGEQKSFTFRHDFSLKVFPDYYPELTRFDSIVSPENNIIPVDYDITFIENTEFHVQQKLISQNTDGTLDEQIFVTKFQAEPELGDPKIVITR